MEIVNTIPINLVGIERQFRQQIDSVFFDAKLIKMISTEHSSNYGKN